MARTSTSLDLSEFFNDDDSEGHRLAEFIRKRRGGFKNQKFLFMDYEPQRLSLNVQLEKIPSSQEELSCDTNENKKAKVSDKKETEKRNIQVRTILSGSLAEDSFESFRDPRLASEPISKIQNSVPTAGPPQSPVKNVSPKTQSPATSCRIEPFTSLNILRSRRVIPRFSSTRKRSGPLLSDGLRRYSLKRLTNLFGGRRTLFHEFENTIQNFDPLVCSTPNSRRNPAKPAPALNSCPSVHAENVDPSSSAKCSVMKNSCCADTLNRSLLRKGEELIHFTEGIQCTPNLNKKRTYTVEKGNTPGQVILAPHENNTSRQPKLLNSTSEPSPSKSLKTQEETLNAQNQHRNLSESHRCSNILEMSRSQKRQQQEIVDFEVPNTPQQKNTSIVFAKQYVEILETQDQQNVGTNSIIIQSARETPFVVIPINQSFNTNCRKESMSTSSSIVANTKMEKVSLAAQSIQQQSKTNDNQFNQVAEDNLKLTDIITDDEDATPKSRSMENNSQAPLDLAKTVNNLRIKRLRKLSSRRRLNMDNSQLHNKETDDEPHFQANINRRISKKKRIPLNKAPGLPLNGETFAQELSRMSNYEILDLRKRNSVGQVFAISGRRSTRSRREDVQKKQQQLDSQIEKELKKRHLSEMTEKQKSLNDATNVDGDGILDERFPVPDEFRDSLPTQVDVRNNSMESSFIDERPTDRISFRNNESNRRSNRTSMKIMPEVLKQYLEASEVLRKKNKFHNSKRSLYSQDLYEMKENDSLIEKAIVQSPPKTHGDIIAAVKTVSLPPFPLQKSATQDYQSTTRSEVDEILHNISANLIENLTATAPLGFEEYSCANTNHVNQSATNGTLEVILHNSNADVEHESDCGANTNNNNQSATNNTHQTVEENSRPNVNTNSSANDNHLFKIPDRPAPRKYIRKQKDKSQTNELIESTTNSQKSANDGTDSMNGTLRRSKRGHVPLKRPAHMFQLLYEQLMNKRFEYYNRKKKNDKQKQREISKVNRNNKNNKVEYTLRRKAEPTKKNGNEKQLPTVPENDSFITCIRPDAEIINTTPPVDQLRNIGPTLKTPRIAQSTLEVKPFRVRVARLKFLPQSTDCSDSVSTSSSITGKNSELISWLKNISDVDDFETCNAEIFDEMRISAASSLTFTQLQGVEYAFYDTHERAYLGYLRFKPRQIKPKKRAKHFHLHFITLMGKFRITANDKVREIGVGDMVAIEKSVYYNIQNITDDFGILMVIKK